MDQPTASLPRAHQTMLLAHRAMVRDLDRLTRTAEQLSGSYDATRAAALKNYAAMLLEVIEHHHEGEDEFFWPMLRERGADEDSLSLMTTEHEELTTALHATRQLCDRLSEGAEAAGELAGEAAKLRTLLKDHADDEEKEYLGRLAPVLDDKAWKALERGMLRTAPKWTLRFMPPWLNSVAGEGEKGGVPAPPVARMFRGWLDRRQQTAFGDNL